VCAGLFHCIESRLASCSPALRWHQGQALRLPRNLDAADRGRMTGFSRCIVVIETCPPKLPKLRLSNLLSFSQRQEKALIEHGLVKDNLLEEIVWSVRTHYSIPCRASTTRAGRPRASTRKAMIVRESFRHRLRGHLFAAALFSIQKRGTNHQRP
jgi:hypothetical protein